MEVSRRIRTGWADLGAIAALVLSAAWLFRDHILGRVLFIGNSDRFHHMLVMLGFYSDNFRKGRISGWDDSMFGGFNALALPFTFPNPLVFLESLAGREHLFYVAGIVCWLLIAGAGCAAYAFLRDVTREPFSALVGATLYQFTALTTLKVSQNDMSFTVLIVIPILMLQIRRIGAGNNLKSFAGLAVAFTCLLTFMFLQKAAYALLLAGGYTLVTALSRRSWRPLIVTGAAFLVGLTASLPRIVTVAEEMSLSNRGMVLFRDRPEDWYLAPVLLRWLDDGIFGRFYSEMFDAGNRLNLYEGMLLYSSTLAVFVLLAGAVRCRGQWLPWPLWRNAELSYLFFFLLFGLAVVAVEDVQRLVFRLFLRRDFIHTRILVACVLPVSTLVAVVLRETCQAPPEMSRKRLCTTLAVVGALAAALLWTDRLLVELGTGQWLDLVYHHELVVPRLFVGSLLHIGLSLVVFVGLYLVQHLGRAEVRWGAGVLLGLLLMGEALAAANFRLNGPQTRAETSPLSRNNMLRADAGDFHGPSDQARARFADRLETQRFRTVIAGKASHFSQFTVTHLGQAWDLRLVEGYLNGVPADLTVLPWPENVVNVRQLLFESIDHLPWEVLSLLNVKYALQPTDALCRNRVADSSGGSREARPDDVMIVQNPLPVVPRFFFAAQAVPAPSLESSIQRVFQKSPIAVLSTSHVEGLETAANFTASGSLDAIFDGDTIDVHMDPAAEPRFLVLNERFHPRWTASAGSTPLPIYRTNGVMRGVIVPPGVSHVVLNFIPFVKSKKAIAFYAGGLLALLAGSWWCRRCDVRGRKHMA